VVYEVWVTNLFAAHKQAAAHQQLEQSWASGQDPLAGSAATGATGTGSTGTGRLPLPGDSQSAIPVGTGIANLYIPRFGSDFAFTIVQGTDDASLEKGPGHYSGTALPGQLGNFAVAGHRVGKGEPFLNLDQLAPGDAVVVETKTQWFVYRVLGDPGTGNLGAVGADGVPGREIVSPSDAAVIDPVPSRPGATPTEQLMTMTTCHPKYTANQRLIVHAKLARTVARQGTALPRELSGGTL
jgi:sortase A